MQGSTVSNSFEAETYKTIAEFRLYREGTDMLLATQAEVHAALEIRIGKLEAFIDGLKVIGWFGITEGGTEYAYQEGPYNQKGGR